MDYNRVLLPKSLSSFVPACRKNLPAFYLLHTKLFGLLEETYLVQSNSTMERIQGSDAADLRLHCVFDRALPWY